MEEIMTLFTYIMFGVFGLCIGSFLNVVIYRWPNNMSIVQPPSHCPKCNYQLKWYDNIPVLSYIMLGGKCRNCKEHISFRYTLVEISNCLLWLLCYALNQANVYLAGIYAITTSIFICVFFIDVEHKIILDRFNIALIVLAFAKVISLILVQNANAFNAVADAMLGGLIGGGFFLFMYYFSKVVFKKEGLGGGDVKFMFATGLLIGWQNILLAILFASLSGAIILTIIQKVRKDDKDHEYPFAPYLVVGSLISMFFGASIINFYLSLFM